LAELYSEAALRHSVAADHLAANGHLDGAGYLIGYVAECAIKHAISSTRPAADAPHVHLPKLVEGARKTLQGRRRHAVFILLEQPGFMEGWAVDMRYAADGFVDTARFQRWRKDANRALAAADLRRSRP